MLLCAMLVSLTAALAQTKVSGTVIQAEDGEPVIGATVKVKGTNQGTLTDVDGRFQINVKTGTTLVFSMIGMEPVEAKAKNGMRVSMSGTTQMNEVMVVAYGTATKASFTGSATVLDNKVIEQVQTTNPMDALAGHVAGVEIVNVTGDPSNQNPIIRMRGITSILAGTDPLIVLDGVPYDGDLNTIAGTDIENMTVLKDAAASALYGARGANGVIIITTKRAKAGHGAVVKLDASLGSNSRGRQLYNTIKAPGQYYETYYQALKNKAIYTDGMNSTMAHKWANDNLISGSYGLGYNVYTLDPGQYLVGANGRLNPNATMGRKHTYGGQDYYLLPDDWADEIYHNGLRQEYNVSVTNATDKSNFLASFGYLDNQGIVDNSSYTRYNGRLKADLKAKPWLKVGANMAYTHYETESMLADGVDNTGANLFALATQIAPIYPLYMRDGMGNIMRDANDYTLYDFGGEQGSWYGIERPHLSNSNGVQDNALNERKTTGNTINANGYAEVTIAKDFKISSTNSVYVDEYRGNSYTNPYYGSGVGSNGQVTVSHGRTFNYNFQQLINWSHIYGKHDVGVMLGHETYWNRIYELAARHHQMFSPDNKELDGAVATDDSGSAQSAYNTEGFFGRAQYNYDSKYFVSASYRRDASSKFHPDNRWGNFYSAGAAWVISQEKFMKKAKWVDFLKLKLSYGEQGNDQIPSYLYTDTYTISNSNGVPAAKPARKGNKDITWEKNANMNLGLEFDLFKGRLSGGIEYYVRKTSDMLFTFPLPPSMGFTSYYANIGDMRNMGVELELNGVAVKTKDVQWSIGANLSHYANEVTMLPDERKTTVLPDGTRGFANGNFFFGEGKSMYNYYMPEYAGVYNKNTFQSTGEAYDPSLDGHSMWYKDGQDGKRMTTVDHDKATDYLLDATMIPTITGGFNTRLDFFGFDFSADFTYSLGGKVYDSDYAMFMGNPSSGQKGTALHKDILNAWSPTNQGSDIPRFMWDGGDENATSLSSRFLTSANYLSLQSLNLGYTLPERLTKKAHIDKLRFFVKASNVWLWTARRGMDPRTAILTSTSYGTTNGNYYSTQRTISGGVSVTF